jgi:hypothetical protein
MAMDFGAAKKLVKGLKVTADDGLTKRRMKPSGAEMAPVAG